MFDTRPLRSAGFRHLAAGYWVNEFGNWIGEIALTLLVFDRTGSALASATLFLALRFLPALLAPLLTVRVEVVSPRVALAGLYLLEAVFFVGIAVLARHFSLPPVLALAALDGVLAITAKALTRTATATGLTRAGLLREGNAILNFGAMAATAGSPVLAGAMVAWKGPSVALLIDAGTFLVTSIIVATATGVEIPSDRGTGFRGRVANGVSAMRSRPALGRLLVATGFALMLAMVAIPVEVVFVKRTLHGTDSGYGLLLTSWGAGMVLGAAGFAAMSSRRLTTVLAGGALLNAAGYCGLAASPTLAVACVFSVIGGTGNGAAWIAAVTAVQERSPASARAAVMSVLEGLNQVMPAVGFLIGGVAATIASPRIAYLISGAGIAIVV
ncbi:MAG: MFS transporter, partial [Acidobacteriota bacterium]|nr:MFS transporter [Acidobacteriota bacterium]